MKRLLLLILLFPLAAHALTADVTLEWTKPTTRENGSPLELTEAQIQYQIYYAPLGSSEAWEVLPVIPGTETSKSYADLALPDTATGIQFYLVTIDLLNSLTSEPSNIASTQIDTINVPIPIDPVSPPGSIIIILDAAFKAN